MNTIGTKLRLTLFGESHGPAVGCTIDGLPAGFSPDLNHAAFELKRRAPHSGIESTSRAETDSFKIVSGMHTGACSGAPVTAIFRNADARESDYSNLPPRPSHADLAASIKYRGFNDPRGGGMFSGRLTAPIVFAGTLCRQLLLEKGVRIASHILKIGSVCDERFDPMMTEFPELDPFCPLIRAERKRDLEDLFSSIRSTGDSIGGSVECAVLGLPVGIGSPFFDGLESAISHLVFSIPGVHGIEFGAGFDFASMKGSEANDPILPSLRTATNHSGGINGGISNGMPLIFRAAFRPVPSVSVPQRSIDPNSGEQITLELMGRHDCCILPRGCAVIEAAAAIAVCDQMLASEIRL